MSCLAWVSSSLGASGGVVTHPHGEGGRQRDVDQTGRVTPVLEQPPGRDPRRPVEQGAVVGAQPREQGHVVRADGHVDRVDLELGEPVDHRARGDDQ